MRTKKILLSIGVGALSLGSFSGVAVAQSDCKTESPNTCTVEVNGEKVETPDAAVKGQVVTRTESATQQDGLGGAQGALALTGGDAFGLTAIGAGLLGAGALTVVASRRKANADS